MPQPYTDSDFEDAKTVTTNVTGLVMTFNYGYTLDRNADGSIKTILCYNQLTHRILQVNTKFITQINK